MTTTLQNTPAKWTNFDHFLHHVKNGGKIINDQNLKSIQISIPKDILHSSAFSNYEIAAYCFLKTVVTVTYTTEHYISYSQASYYLTGSTKYSKRFPVYIKNGIDALIQKEVVRKIESSKSEYIIDCSSLWDDTKDTSFVIIDFYEIRKIFQITDCNSFQLLRYFLVLIGTISSSIDVWIDSLDHKSRVVGNMTIEYISDLSGISPRTIKEYNRILENNQLLYIFRQDDFLLSADDKNISRMANVYGRPDDKLYIDSYANSQKKEKKSYKWINSEVENANRKRKLAQMYNQIAKGKGQKYSLEEIQQVYDYIHSENSKYRAMYKENKYEEYLMKQRDETVFEKFNLKKEG